MSEPCHAGSGHGEATDRGKHGWLCEACWVAVCRMMSQWARHRLVTDAAGVCCRCGDPSPTPRCRECQVEASRQVGELHDARRAEGLCECGAEPRPDRATCCRCADRKRRIAARAAVGADPPSHAGPTVPGGHRATEPRR